MLVNRIGARASVGAAKRALSKLAATAPRAAAAVRAPQAPAANRTATFATAADAAKSDDDLSAYSSLQTNAAGETEFVTTSSRPRIVILGTGWGSVNFLKNLDANKYEVLVISPRNYFLFTPLLPSACTGTLEMGSITEPIRQILLARHSTRENQYIEATTVGLNRDTRKVSCVDSNGRPFVVEYDHLIIGVGANNNTFNTPGVRDYAHFLKEAKHAVVLRSKILNLFERAASPTLSQAEKEALLQFVVVGGGPTGVEFAGELVDFVDSDLKKQFPALVPLVSVKLIQGTDHILNTYDEAISLYAEKKFSQMRIDVITNAFVKNVEEKTISYMDKGLGRMVTIPFALCLWSTGIEMNDFTRSVAATIPGHESHRALVTDGNLRLLKEIPHADRMPQRVVAQAAAAVAAPEPAAVPEPDARLELEVDPRVYTLGDCASTYVPKLSKRLKPIFAAADTNGDGKLSQAELRALCSTLSQRVPVLSASMATLANMPTRTGTSGDIDLEQFGAMLAETDRNVRAYPATAQVASQQGKYLAKRFNAFAKDQVRSGKMADQSGADHLYLQQRLAKEGVQQRAIHPAVTSTDASDAISSPFRYRHLGSLAYIGDDAAVFDINQTAFGSYGILAGNSTFWLWKSVYFNDAVSMRTRLNMGWDWIRTAIFGRDTSKQ